MKPKNFPEANTTFGPPGGMDESQVRSVPAYCASIKGGSLDGSNIVVVAWQPDADDIARIVAGEPIFLSMIGSLAPHFLTTKFNDAIGL